MNQIEQGERRREQIMEFLAAYIDENGYGPSYEEVAVAVGVYKNSVGHHLKKLEQQGRVTMTPGKYRSLRIVQQGDTDVRDVSTAAAE